MKKLLIIVLAVLTMNISQAQIFSYGLKAGVNSSKISFSDISVDKAPSLDYGVAYNYITDQIDQGNLVFNNDGNLVVADGKTPDIPPSGIVNEPKLSFSPSSYEMGFHFGAFARIKILGVFLQPELIFSQTNAAINLNPEGFDLSQAASEVRSSKITYNNFDVPVLLGFKIGPAHICAGPVATFKLNSGLDDATKKLLEDIDAEDDMDVFTVTKNATFGAQIGTGLTIAKKITIDVRYEFGLSKLGDKVTIRDREFNTDQRGSQFIGSVGWMF